MTSSLSPTALPSWLELPDPRRALQASDPELFDVIEKERGRQVAGIELIASENYVSSAVLAASFNI